MTRLLRHLGSFALLTGILPSTSRLRFDWLSRQFEFNYSCPVKRKNGSADPFSCLMGRVTRFELATPGTTNQCSNQLSYTRHTAKFGGADRTRTDDPLHAMQVLYQLSYNPMCRDILYFFLLNVKLIC